MSLIANTTTTTGLRIKAALDTNSYDKSVEVTDDEFSAVNIKPRKFHGDWNYAISPLPP